MAEKAIRFVFLCQESNTNVKIVIIINIVGQLDKNVESSLIRAEFLFTFLFSGQAL